jgi:hypothetical protein
MEEMAALDWEVTGWARSALTRIGFISKYLVIYG